MLKVLAAAARHLPPRVLKAGGGALFLIIWSMPRRPPDLPRFTASTGFGALHARAVEWTSSQFGLIESGAPWLEPVGHRVDDSCRVRVDGDFDFRLAVIGAECDRSVTTVYGADGDITARLADLGVVLGSAGWGEFFSYGVVRAVRQGDLDLQDPPVTARWQQAPLPAGREAVPPAGVRLARSANIGWTSRGAPADPKWTLDGRWRAGHQAADPEPPKAANRCWHPVECHYADISVLAERALAEHEHAVAIRIPICYYFNPDVRRYPIRRRIFPVLPFPRSR